MICVLFVHQILAKYFLHTSRIRETNGTVNVQITDSEKKMEKKAMIFFRFQMKFFVGSRRKAATAAVAAAVVKRPNESEQILNSWLNYAYTRRQSRKKEMQSDFPLFETLFSEYYYSQSCRQQFRFVLFDFLFLLLFCSNLCCRQFFIRSFCSMMIFCNYLYVCIQCMLSSLFCQIFSPSFRWFFFMQFYLSPLL